LEQVLAMRKREARMKRLERMKRNGRVIEQQPAPAPKPRAHQRDKTPEKTLDEVVASIAQNPTGKPAEPIAFVDEDTGSEQVVAPAADPDRQPPKPPNKLGKRAMNSLLLLVEIAAVVGLLYLGYELLQGINILEDRTAEAQQELEAARNAAIPTIEPTPMLALNQVVLPGGHKFVEGQTPTLNVEEIPENVRFAVADQIMRPVINRPPVTDETALRLTVPKLNIDQAIVQGADWEALKQGVGQVLNGYDPGDDVGNVALTAHNDIYGELFKDLDQLEAGDQFQIQTREHVHLYEVTGTEIVSPTDVHVLESQGKATAVLISCYPYRVNTQRIVVFADRVG
jgi:sortase A